MPLAFTQEDFLVQIMLGHQANDLSDWQWPRPRPRSITSIQNSMGICVVICLCAVWTPSHNPIEPIFYRSRPLSVWQSHNDMFTLTWPWPIFYFRFRYSFKLNGFYSNTQTTILIQTFCQYCNHFLSEMASNGLHVSPFFSWEKMNLLKVRQRLFVNGTVHLPSVLSLYRIRVRFHVFFIVTASLTITQCCRRQNRYSSIFVSVLICKYNKRTHLLKHCDNCSHWWK